MKTKDYWGKSIFSAINLTPKGENFSLSHKDQHEEVSQTIHYLIFLLRKKFRNKAMLSFDKYQPKIKLLHFQQKQ